VTQPEWEAGSPYAGPPQYGAPQYGATQPRSQPQPPYVPPQYGQPQYAPPPYPPAQYAQPGWGPAQYSQPYGPPGYAAVGAPGWAPHPPARRGSQRPGAVIGATVFALVSALLVLLGTFYAAAFGALLSLARGPGSGMEIWFALLQVAQAGLLVGGAFALFRRDRRWLLGAVVVQLGLCGYWYVVLGDLALSVMAGGAGALPVLYGVLAALAGGLTFLPEARAWTRRPAPTEEPAAEG